MKSRMQKTKNALKINTIIHLIKRKHGTRHTPITIHEEACESIDMHAVTNIGARTVPIA